MVNTKLTPYRVAVSKSVTRGTRHFKTLAQAIRLPAGARARSLSFSIGGAGGTAKRGFGHFPRVIRPHVKLLIGIILKVKTKVT